MRVLLLGGSGQLGRELRPLFADVVVPSHDVLDVTDADALRTTIAKGAFDVVINATAENRVDAAEDNPTPAERLNATMPAIMAEAAQAAGAFVVHVSTDYVFDGTARRPYTEDDAPNPQGAYARSKLAGERGVAAATARHAVVRVAGLYAAGGSRGKGGSFIDRVLAQAQAGQALRIVDDQVTAPTWARDVAAALARLVPRWIAGTAPAGLYHMTNAGQCSWYAFAEAALALAGVHAALTPVSSTAFAAAAPRPAFSVLANARLAAIGEPPLRPWREALAAYLASRDPR